MKFLIVVAIFFAIRIISKIGLIPIMTFFHEVDEDEGDAKSVYTPNIFK